MGMGGLVGSVDGRDREKRRGGGAKRDRVPVPVLMSYSAMFMFLSLHFIPIRSVLAISKYIADQI